MIDFRMQTSTMFVIKLTSKLSILTLLLFSPGSVVIKYIIDVNDKDFI